VVAVSLMNSLFLQREGCLEASILGDRGKLVYQSEKN
jgi:hypothetical protein